MFTVILFLWVMLGLLSVVSAAEDVFRFDGSPWMLNSWFEAMDAWYVYKALGTNPNPIDDAAKIVLWKMFVTPDVLLWYLEQEAEISWDGIKGMMRGYYLNDGVQGRAFDQLMTIHQTGSVESYNTFFTRLVQSIMSNRLTPTLLVNRYISGLNRTLAKGVLARSPADWKRAQIDALELAGTPAYTKSESSGFTSNPSKGKSKQPKTAMTTITALMAQDESETAYIIAQDEEIETTPLLAYRDTMSTFNLVSPSVVYWAELEVQHSNTPYHVCYSADSRPIYLHDRVLMAVRCQTADRMVKTTKIPFYVLRIPYVHLVFGKEMEKLLEKVRMTVEAEKEEGRKEGGENVGGPEDPENYYSEPPARIITSEIADTPTVAGELSRVGEITEPIHSERVDQSQEGQQPVWEATVWKEGKYFPRRVLMLVSKANDWSARKDVEWGPARLSPVVMECRELGWWGTIDKAKPPPRFFPEEQLYK
jgi:hypothetical protein